MALFQNDIAKGFTQIAQPRDANALNTARFSYAFTAAASAGDIIEIGVLPMHCRVRSMTIVPEGFGAAVNFDVGIISGEPGANDAARTMGAEFFSAQAVNATVVGMSAATGFNLAPTSAARGIGIKPATGIALNANQKFHLLVDYYQ